MNQDKTNTIIALVTTFFAAIAALAAGWSVFQTSAMWIEQKEFGRPYISFTETPQFRQMPDSSENRMWLKLENIGGRPAYDVYIRVFVVDKRLNKEPELSFTFHVGNEFPPKIPMPWYQNINIPKEAPPKYIVTALRYRDKILDKSYNQTIYMKWMGVDHEGRFDPDFYHVTMKEKQKIEGHLMKELQEFL